VYEHVHVTRARGRGTATNTIGDPCWVPRAHVRHVLLAVVLVTACKSKRDAHKGEALPVVVASGDAMPADAAAAAQSWPELETYPHIQPRHVVTVPSRRDVPRFEVGGPAIVGDVAAVASSQFGFAGVDWRRGLVTWVKPAGAHVAPPLATGTGFVLIGECITPPSVRDTETLLGCMRIVTAAGADEAYVAIHAKTSTVATFASAAGMQDVWPDGDHAVRWRRGEAAVSIDLVSGVASPAPITPPPIVVAYKEHRWEIRQVEGRLIASEQGHEAWSTKREYTAILGAVYLPDQSPMIRVANVGAFAGQPEMNLLDIDATGSLHGQAAFPVPGIGLLGFGASSIGDVAIAVRIDRSIERDFIAGYAANSLLMWVYPLPVVPRPDPVGVALASDAVVVFHDGDTVTILPELSAPPTAPGAARVPSQNPTP
jgi:hypothetical protein